MVNNLSSPEIDGLVMKRGRTTGVTVGRVNALPSDLVIREPWKLKKGVSFKVRAVLSGEMPRIVGRGDSGAWFLNMDGDWIGSIVGSHGPQDSGASVYIVLVVEAEKIVEDIERFTGKKVVSPKRS